MTCKCHPDSPFLWMNRTEPSIFAKDHTFCPKGAKGVSAAQLATDVVEEKRREGKMHGTIHGLGSKKAQEEAVLAYKQFGVFTRAKPNVKPTLNKHEK